MDEIEDGDAEHDDDDDDEADDEETDTDAGEGGRNDAMVQLDLFCSDGPRHGRRTSFDISR
jgi:hypothetical protein